MLYSDNAMDPNWGGAEYTQALVDTGYYKGNEVCKCEYDNAINEFINIHGKISETTKKFLYNHKKNHIIFYIYTILLTSSFKIRFIFSLSKCRKDLYLIHFI